MSVESNDVIQLSVKHFIFLKHQINDSKAAGYDLIDLSAYC